MSVRKDIQGLKERMQADIVGQSEILDALLIALLAGGNLLVEGLPGLAKTRAIKALARNLEASFNRIQFTPDLSAPDIIGRQVYYESETGGKGKFEFVPGPVFANIVLADEVNRAPSKSQNSLLEAMEEHQVTVAGVTHKMEKLFLVMATQNPVEQDGTYPLPEAQKDRFLMHVIVRYPTEEAEMDIIRLVRGEKSQKAEKEQKTPVLTSQDIIFKARGEIDNIKVPADIEKYMVDLIFATRYPQRYTYELKSFIREGASPRATLALDRTARAHAWLKGQDTVTLENVYAMLKNVLRHRLIRGERAIDHKITPDDIVDEIVELVPIPESLHDQVAGKKKKYKK